MAVMPTACWSREGAPPRRDRPPSTFHLLFNAQFFGAAVASLLPKMRSTSFVVTLIIFVSGRGVWLCVGLAVQSTRGGVQGLSTPLKHGDEVTIIPALAGGGR